MTPVFLYLDPGTGSLLLYAVVGVTTTVLFALRGFWYSLRSRLFLGKKGAVRQMPDIVFQSEGGKYWQVFQPVLQALDSYGIRYGYVTPDKNDPVFKAELKNVVPICPGKELMTLSYMNNIKAKIVVSTTPQLDVYMLKRSKHVKEYIHLFHTATDIGLYEMYGFDYYDTLLCTGPYQKDSIRSIEKNRHEPAKKLLDTGCTCFDYMEAELKKLQLKQNEDLTILYAPAWGIRSSVVTHGSAVIDVLTAAGIKVIFRPHPQMYVSDTEGLRAVEEKIKNNSLVELDRNRTAVESMTKSHAMITDFSGVIFDYAFLFERPIFIVNAEYEFGGCDVIDVDGGRVWEVDKCHEITRMILPEDICRLDKIIREEINNAEMYQQKIRKIKSAEIYNYGHAGEVAAAQLLELLKKHDKEEKLNA